LESAFLIMLGGLDRESKMRNSFDMLCFYMRIFLLDIGCIGWFILLFEFLLYVIKIIFLSLSWIVRGLVILFYLLIMRFDVILFTI
jgi:hypothetical protein